ncbi:MAG TPA: hypothetical protein VMU47_23765 [Caldimonas sp.]|nr:hypothetical protein [Caldimonas sp.]
MPAPILHLGASVLCAHAGQATPLAPFPRVLLSGQPAVTLASPYAVAACALTGTPTPPCVTGQWMVGATRVLAGGVPVATMAGASTCIPTGTPMLPVAAQTRVLAT